MQLIEAYGANMYLAGQAGGTQLGIECYVAALKQANEIRKVVLHQEGAQS